MSASTLVSRKWCKECASAILKKNGAALADCINATREEGILEPAALEQLAAAASTDSPDTIEAIVSSTRKLLQGDVDALVPGPDNDHKENRMYVEMLARLVGAAAVYKQSSVVKPARRGEASGQQEVSGRDQAIKARTTACNKLVQALLFAFESLQQVHLQDRSHYSTIRSLSAAAAGGTSERKLLTTGSPGWDTVPLMTLIHMVQRAAQNATSVDEEALNHLVRSWRKMLIYLQSADPNVPAEVSRRRGALPVVNGLLIMLFQHNNTHQCRVLLSSIEASEKQAEATNDPTKSVLQPAKHMIAEVIKFRYYQGRMKLYEKKFQEAFDCLMLAYKLAPQVGTGSELQQKNKLRIHFYLLVAGVCCGMMPPPELLAADSLTRQIFTPIIIAIREGDPLAFSKALDRHSSVLRKRGVFMLLQQVRILCYLFLMARTHQALAQLGQDGSRISLELLVDIFTAQAAAKHSIGLPVPGAAGDEASSPSAKRLRVERESVVSVDALALWVARLIARGFVKGYLSCEHKIIVLSKASPFPTLVQA
jgi:hypothetical protein